MGKSGDCCYNNQNPHTDRRMSKSKTNPQFHRVWCLSCKSKSPPVITGAAYLVPVRERPYDMIRGTVDIDRRLAGACESCTESKNKFQKSKKLPVDPENINLVSRVDNV